MTKSNRARGHAHEESASRRDGADATRRRISMHEGVAVWCDCCSCEMEPYWAEEMGVEADSDYEDGGTDSERGGE